MRDDQEDQEGPRPDVSAVPPVTKVSLFVIIRNRPWSSLSALHIQIGQVGAILYRASPVRASQGLVTVGARQMDDQEETCSVTDAHVDPPEQIGLGMCKRMSP